MQGVTTAIVAFIFVCIVFPKLVQNKAQYYVAVFCAIGIILLDALAVMISLGEHSSLRVLLYVAVAVLQIIAILMVFMGCGGASLSELAGEMGNAIEVIRRGGEEKEVIIPLSGEMARLKAQRDAERAAAGVAGHGEPQRYEINDPPVVVRPPPPPPPPQRETGSIPLEP